MPPLLLCQLIRSVSFIEGPLDKLLNNFSQLWFQNSCPWFLFQGAEWPEFMVGDKNVAKKWQTCARVKLVPGIFRRNWITRPRSGHNFRFSTFKLFITTVQSPDNRKRSSHSCDNIKSALFAMILLAMLTRARLLQFYEMFSRGTCPFYLLPVSPTMAFNNVNPCSKKYGG